MLLQMGLILENTAIRKTELDRGGNSKRRLLQTRGLIRLRP